MDVMIDLETMSSRCDAAIVAIGAVQFDPLGETPLDPIDTECNYYDVIDLQSCIDAGLHVSGNTVGWWLQQSEEARKAIATPPIIKIDQSLIMFKGWFEQFDKKITHVWAHANFDLSIIDSAYDIILHETVPWKYYNARDVRTIYDLAYPNAKVPNIPDINKHHALYDAWRQAIGVQECYKKLRVNS